MTYAGLDVGTSAIKAIVVDGAGELLAHTRVSLPSVDADGTQDPEDWWQASLQALDDVARQLDDVEIAAVGICGQAPSPVFVDADGHALGRSPTWQYRHAAAWERALFEAHGHEADPLSLRLTARLRAVAEQEPERLDRCAAVQNSFDYIASRLTGVIGSSNPLHFSRATSWTRGQPVATIRPELAQRLRLRGPIVLAGVDAFASVIGSGVSQPGEVCLERGTSGAVSVVLSPGVVGRFELDPGIAVASWATQCVGAAVDWALALFDRSADRADVLADALCVSPGARGLVFLPYLAGERAPIDDPHARGVLFGLSLEHRVRDVMRAVLEGVAFSTRHVLDTKVQSATSVRVVGALGRTPGLDQLWADALGRRLDCPRFVDTAALGAAMVAAVAVGGFDGLRAASVLNPIESTVVPSPSATAPLDAAYQLYRDLSARMTELYPLR